MKIKALVSLTATVCLLANVATLPLFIFATKANAIEESFYTKQNDGETITGYDALDVIEQSLEEIFQAGERYPQCNFQRPQGFPTLDFNLSSPLDRASTAILLSRSFLGPVEEFARGSRSNPSFGASTYSDVMPNAYYYRDLAYLADGTWRSIMLTSSGTFRPYQQVTSTEFYGFFTNAYRQANVLINNQIRTCRSSSTTSTSPTTISEYVHVSTDGGTVRIPGRADPTIIRRYKVMAEGGDYSFNASLRVDAEGYPATLTVYEPSGSSHSNAMSWGGGRNQSGEFTVDVIATQPTDFVLELYFVPCNETGCRYQ